jgi:hypothetical protein
MIWGFYRVLKNILKKKMTEKRTVHRKVKWIMKGFPGRESQLSRLVEYGKQL